MKKAKKQPVEYSHALEAERIARDLINNHHTHLSSSRIDYLFASETPKKKGKDVWGSARVVTGLNAYLAGMSESGSPESFFVITIAKPVWSILTEEQKKALVDHELSYCDVDLDKSTRSILSHDVEEFGAVVRRHGLWREEVANFLQAAEAAKQKGLFDPEETEVTIGLVEDGKVTKEVTTATSRIAEVAKEVKQENRNKARANA